MQKIRNLVAALLRPIQIGCAAVDTVLEPRGVHGFKVEELLGAKPTGLRISGRCRGGAMAVSRITSKVEESSMVVQVHVALVVLMRRGSSGSFQYELSVPDSVNEVRFGNSLTPVWRRGTK